MNIPIDIKILAEVSYGDLRLLIKEYYHFGYIHMSSAIRDILEETKRSAKTPKEALYTIVISIFGEDYLPVVLDMLKEPVEDMPTHLRGTIGADTVLALWRLKILK